MIYTQITSGTRGTIEASLATKIVYDYIKNNYQIKIFDVNQYTNDKSINNIPRSIVFEVKESSDTLFNDIYINIVGTWKVIFNSPFREVKRKNWFVKVTTINSSFIYNNDNEIWISDSRILFKSKDFKIQTFHCSGNGGQNINKVETGVRLIYIPENIVVECTEERSQYQNRQKAIKKMQEKISNKKAQELSRLKNNIWGNSNIIERGNEIMTLKIKDNELKRFIDMEVTI